MSTLHRLLVACLLATVLVTPTTALAADGGAADPAVAGIPDSPIEEPADGTGSDDAGDATEDAGDATGDSENTTDDAGDVTDATDDAEDATDDAANATDDVDDVSDAEGDGDAAERVDEVGDAVGNATDEVGETANGTREVSDAADTARGDSGDATDGASDSAENATGDVENATEGRVAGTDRATVRAATRVRSAPARIGANATAEAEAGAGGGADGDAATTAPSGSDDGGPAASAGEGATSEGRVAAADSRSSGGVGPGSGGVPVPGGGAAAAGVGAGVVAAGVAARQLSAVGGTGAGTGTAATVSSTATTAARGLTGTLSELTSRARRAVETGLRFVGLGYHKWAGDDPLEHGTRERLVERVEDSPGVYLSALREAVDEPMGTVRYHLKILEREGIVVGTKIRGRRRYYPVGDEPDALDALLDEDGPADVLRALARDGACSGLDVADAIDRDPSTVSHHLSRLEEAGVVERERDGRSVVNRLTPEVEAVLAPRVGEPPDGDGEVDAARADD